MIELIQFPWSPFCLVQRRILEFSVARFKLSNLPLTGDRSRVWEITRQRYYAVPVIKDGRNVVFESAEDSQAIAKYLDQKLGLGLFPVDLEGVQFIMWRYIESEVESLTFKLNDSYAHEFVAKADFLSYLRHKERKFGHGCLQAWAAERKTLLRQLEAMLMPFEAMLAHQPFLMGDRPRFVDFDLWGMLANFLYSGHYALPKAHAQIIKWYRRMARLKRSEFIS